MDGGVTASISGLTITGGSVIGNGGGLVNLGTITLTDCTISSNSAAGDGGGLFNSGTATLTLCTIAENSAGSDGGGRGYTRNVDVSRTGGRCNAQLQFLQHRHR